MRSVESLNPDDSQRRYFRPASMAAEEGNQEDETRTWLKLMDGLDYSAKLLIRFCLTKAAETTLDKSAEWVALAEAAGADSGVEFTLVRIVFDENNLLKESDPDQAARKRLEDRINRLEDFARMAIALSAGLRQQLQPAPGGEAIRPGVAPDDGGTPGRS